MYGNTARRSNDNPSLAPSRAWNSPRKSLDCPWAIFEMTNPAVISGGVRMIVQYGGAEAGPTARHLNYTRESTSEQLPCVQV